MGSISRIKEIREILSKENLTLDEYYSGQELQLTVRSNKKKPNQPVFIMPDGRIGFPSENSIPVEIGDVIKGHVAMISDSYAFVTASEIIHRNTKDLNVEK